MTRFRTVTAAAALSWLLPLAASSEYRPERIRWSELDFQTRKLGLSIDARLQLHKLGAAELRHALVEPRPGSWLAAPAAGGWELALTTTGLGKRSELSLLIDDEGRSLQRVQLETGRRLKDYHRRTHRFGDTAVHIRTLKPEAGEQDSSFHEWTRLDDWLAEFEGGFRPLQATGLFYALAAGDLDRPGDRLETWLFGRNGISEVALEVEARELVDVDFIEVDRGIERRREESIRALRIRVVGSHIDDDSADSDFRFVGLRGNVKVFVDEATRAPLLITGKIGWFARAQVKLQRLVLGDP